MQKSLRIRLTVILIGLAIGPLVTIGIFLAQRSFAIERRQALELQSQVAQSAANEIEAFLQEVENDISSRGNELRGVEEADRAQQLSILLTALGSGPYRDVYDQFTLLNAEGQEVQRVSRSNTVPQDELVDRSTTAEFEQPRATGNVYYSPVWLDEATGKPSMTIAVPLYELRSVQLSGVLVADIDFTSVEYLIDQMDTGENQTVFIVDPESGLLDYGGSLLQLQDLTFEVPEQSVVQVGPNDIDSVLGVHTIQLGDKQFSVVAERPVTAALELANNTLRSIILVTVIALAVAVGLGFLMVRQIVTPIESLSETVELIGKGDLSQRAQVNTKDEIGVLAESFNSMTSQLTETLEMERVARLEAQEASRAKDLFLATMSHELRTPLNAMIGFLGLMLYSEQLDDDNVHMAERSIANAERLLSLINNILDLSRITVGRLEIIPVEVQPEQLAKAIEDDMALRFKEKDLDLVVEVDQRLPTTIVHDEERLVQIATNLIGNAIKFTDEGEVRMSLIRNRDRLIVKVADTGIGIPTSKQQIIFDEFTQVDSSSTRNYGGAGLGLSIVKQLAILMRGSVSVESTMGEGSTFTVDLPLNLEDPQHEERRGNLELVAQGA